MDEFLEQLVNECTIYTQKGTVASYIPELSKVQCANVLGVYIVSSDGKCCFAGEHNHKFTIQSIVKPILLLQALLDNGIDFVRTRVGVPAKSGVGGGIMAVVPTRMGIGIYSPALDLKGNSVAGIQMLEKLSKQLYLSIF